VWPGRDLCGRVAQPLLAFCAALAVRRAARFAVWRLNDNLSNEPTPNPETPQGDDHTGRRLCCARVRRHLVNLVQIKLRGMTHWLVSTNKLRERLGALQTVPRYRGNRA
jgi:hypothetical protein